MSRVFNFARRPFQDDRPIYVATVALLAIGAALLLANVRLYTSYRRQVADTKIGFAGIAADGEGPTGIGQIAMAGHRIEVGHRDVRRQRACPATHLRDHGAIAGILQHGRGLVARQEIMAAEVMLPQR